MRHMHKRRVRSTPLHYIAFWQAAIFFMLICLVWVNEMLDLPNLIYGCPPHPADPIGASILTAAIIVVGFINIAYSYVQHRRILAGMFKVCSYCGKVEVDPEQWEKMDLFVAGRTNAQFTHGVCPECYRKMVEKIQQKHTSPSETGDA
ncbi:MAG: hypothetical protein DRP22_03850 [Verrucomicrobia bacterium]|nr:MAG: hypothetical protein DRP22_03850 [Verrucomicrobiota bacterium]